MHKPSSIEILAIIFAIIGICVLSWIGTDSYNRYQERQQEQLEHIRDNM